MKTAQQLREEWAVSEYRKEWLQVLQSKAWAKLTELLKAEILDQTARGARTHLTSAYNEVMVRLLMHQEGFIAALEAMSRACDLPKTQEPPEEEYSDAYVQKLQQERKEI